MSSAKGPGAVFVAAALLAALPLTLLFLPADLFTALYSNALYPWLTALLTPLTAWTTVPLGLLALPLVSGYAAWRAVRPRRRLPLATRIARLGLLLAGLWAGYMIIWGANYSRPPLPDLLELAGQPPDEREMTGLAYDMLAWLEANEGAPADPQAALAEISGELEYLAGSLGSRVELPSLVKTLPAGSLLRSGYAGMIFPLTLEAQVDGALAPHSRVAVGAHELAHVAGFAAEADADLAAVIAALRAEDPFARYAMALSLLARTLGSLPQEVRDDLTARLPRRALEDLAESRLRSAHYLRPTLAKRVTDLYDSLLRRQGVAGGVTAYGRIPQQAAIARRHGLLPEAPAMQQPGDTSRAPAGNAIPGSSAAARRGPDHAP